MEETAIVVQEQTEQATLPIAIPEASEIGDLQILARYPYQMQACQNRLIEWAKAKVLEASGEVADLDENYKIAIRNKWGASATRPQCSPTAPDSLRIGAQEVSGELTLNWKLPMCRYRPR